MYYINYISEYKGGGITTTPPAVEVRLEYPRQTIATTSYSDINNLGDRKISSVVDDALQVIDNISTNTLQRVQ